MNIKRKLLYILIIIFTALTIPQIGFAQNNEEDILEALESSVSGNLFFSYMTIKSTAHAYKSGEYTKEATLKIIEITNRSLTNIKLDLEDIKDFDFSRSTKTLILSSIKAIDNLLDSSDALRIYTKSRNDKDFDSFIKKLEKAWNSISSLLTNN